MKITDVKQADPVFIALRKLADAINDIPTVMPHSYLQVFTDEGISGISPVGGNPDIIEHVLKPYVIGEDPLNTERIWEKMYWGCLQQSGRRGAAIESLGAIDVAIWDLKGKILNQPVHKLLGAFRDTVPVYGSGINLNYTIDELIEEMTGFVAKGFKMVKMKIGKRDPKEDLERIRLVRDAIGPEIDLAVDVNNGWSLNAALKLARELEQYDIAWLEEPILADEIDNLAKLAQETSIPVAVGENHYTRWEFKQLMETGAAGIVQPIVGKCGGVTEFLKIAALADSYGIGVCPHFSYFTDVPLVAGISNGVICEYAHEYYKAIEQLFVDPVRPCNGEISPSKKPGFGVEVNEELIDRLRKEIKPGREDFRYVTTKGWRWPPYL